MKVKCFPVSRIVTILGMLTALLFCVSCADGHTDSSSFDEQETLRTEAENREEKTQWTLELESTRLEENITAITGIDSSIALSPDVALLMTGNAQAVYPSLNGFGSLDTSEISTDVRQTADNFCSALVKGQPAEQYMAQGSLFSLILFAHDFTDLCNSKYGEPPVTELKKTAEKNSADDAPKTSDVSDQKEEDEKTVHQLFTSWMYGAPFIDGDAIEIPVRIEGTKGSVDFQMFIITGTENKISKLCLTAWRNNDGKN